MPSIEDETWEYWCNEVEANCPTLRDKVSMAYKALEFKCFADENKPSRDHMIQTLIEDYIDKADISDLIHIIADALRNKEVDYD